MRELFTLFMSHSLSLSLSLTLWLISSSVNVASWAMENKSVRHWNVNLTALFPPHLCIPPSSPLLWFYFSFHQHPCVCLTLMLLSYVICIFWMHAEYFHLSPPTHQNSHTHAHFLSTSCPVALHPWHANKSVPCQYESDFPESKGPPAGISHPPVSSIES